MLPSRNFSDLTQPEIATQFKKNPLVILPAGSVEQHGPHLPAGTDSFAANLISAELASRMDGLVLPGPTIGVTPMHMPYEGTITFNPQTYIQVVTEICASTAVHGAKSLMIVNWHEGNIPSLAIAAEDLHRRHGMTVLTVQACYVAADLFGDECNGLTHGGEIEALVVMAFRPELVHLDRIDKPDGFAVYLGTLYHDDDLASEILEAPGWACLVIGVHPKFGKLEWVRYFNAEEEEEDDGYDEREAA